MRLACFRYLLCALSIAAMAGCDAAEKKPSVVKRPLDEELTGEYGNPTEREYARMAYEFAKSLQSGDYSTAYNIGSSHLQSRMRVEELERLESQSKREFGIPIRIFTDPVVNMDSSLLAGPRMSDSGHEGDESQLRNMKSMRAVGEIPTSIPVGIRRASVRLEIERDPQSIPDFQERTGLRPDEMTEQDRVVSYLTVVIIEESRTFGVAYYFHRWPDIWDEELSPENQSADRSLSEDGETAESVRR